jgi:hypothetical protein
MVNAKFQRGAEAMNKTQRRLARHALGLPNRAMCSYRNRFVIYAGDANTNALDSLVLSGLATSFTLDRMITYRLTRTGAELALDPGERLDEEDF